MSDKPIYSRKIIDIAEYIFANPMAKRRDVLAKFGKKWQIPTRTLDRMWKLSKEYNQTRIQKQEKATDDILESKAKTNAENALKTREFYITELEKDFIRLGEIKSGDVFKDIDKKTGNVVGYRQAGYNDEIQAKRSRTAIVQHLAEINGWNAPTKTAQTDSKGNDINYLSPEEAALFIKEMTKDYSKE